MYTHLDVRPYRRTYDKHHGEMRDHVNTNNHSWNSVNKVNKATI